MFVSSIPNDLAGQPIPGGEFNVDHAAVALQDLRASLRAGDIQAADAALTILQTEAGAEATAQVDNDLGALATALSLSNFERATTAATLLQHDLANSISATAPSPLTTPIDVVTLDASAQLALPNDTTNTILNPLTPPASVGDLAALAGPVPPPIPAPIQPPAAAPMDASTIAMEIASSLAASFSATYVANVAEAEEEDRIEFVNEPESTDETVAAVPQSAKLDLLA